MIESAFHIIIILISLMNQLLIAKNQPENMEKKVFFVERANAHMIMPALRS